MDHARLKKEFDRLSRRYAGKTEREKDPVSFVYRYTSWRDREIAGFIAACLAYGRVETILKSVAEILEPLGKRPSVFIRSGSGDFSGLYGNFRHRLNKGSDIRLLLLGLRTVLAEHGSLKALFTDGLRQSGGDLLSGQSAFIAAIRNAVLEKGRLRRIPPGRVLHLLPDPSAGSACKRLNLFLRWMARKDTVDPGVWLPGLDGLKRDLIIPLDTHIAKTGRRYGMTRRKSDDLRTAREITAVLSVLCPADPLRYDFCLCHHGMAGHRKKVRNRAT